MIGPADPIGWAKQPRSPAAIAAVKDLAGKDRRFRMIWAALVEAGVATPEGKPLETWDGKQWIKV